MFYVPVLWKSGQTQADVYFLQFSRLFRKLETRPQLATLHARKNRGKRSCPSVSRLRQGFCSSDPCPGVGAALALQSHETG